MKAKLVENGTTDIVNKILLNTLNGAKQ